MQPKILHTIKTKLQSQNRAAEQTTLSLLETCKNLTNLKETHARIIKIGLQNNPLVLTKLTSTSSSLNATFYASNVLFSTETDPRVYDAFLFNTLIRSHALGKNSSKMGVEMYNLMRVYGVFPNKYTFPFVLKACAGVGELRLCEAVHGLVVKFGFGCDGHVRNTMVYMYCCCGESGVGAGRRVFDEMSERDCVAWSVMIGGYARFGNGSEGVALFRQMQVEGVSPDEITMVNVLSACTSLGALELGKWVESYVEKEKVKKSVELCNALIDMFAKCGEVDKALKLFKDMKERSIVSWTSVIVGLAMHGRGVEAVALFEEMIGSGLDPDDVAFIGLLSACSHSGSVDKGREYFDSMKRDYGIIPKIEHYGCMVDMLCRTGLVKEAFKFVQEMPIKPNPVILRTLINACRAHGELDVGERISKWLIRNDPMHESNYVLLSNIYAKLSKWEKKTAIREVMDKRGMKKIPGSTMIELDNQIHEFVAGDKSHEQRRGIYEMLDEMQRKIKKAGYVTTTSEVLVDIDDEDKEDTLNTHSEKLAISFALLNTPPGSPIRIVKNLRVCSDCHSATKFISKIYNREIVMRDRNRFHHFKNGVCSCGDFW